MRNELSFSAACEAHEPISPNEVDKLPIADALLHKVRFAPITDSMHNASRIECICWDPSMLTHAAVFG